jgi:hypothetical protein
MKLHWRFFIASLIMLLGIISIPGFLFPVCEGCCVCSVSAHFNERILLEWFFLGLAFFFFSMSLIEEWANGS